MTATVRLFAGAAEAVGADQVRSPAPTVGELIVELDGLGGPGTAAVLRRCSVIVDGARAEGEDVLIPDGVIVDVLPPFAGG